MVLFEYPHEQHVRAFEDNDTNIMHEVTAGTELGRLYKKRSFRRWRFVICLANARPIINKSHIKQRIVKEKDIPVDTMIMNTVRK